MSLREKLIQREQFDSLRRDRTHKVTKILRILRGENCRDFCRTQNDSYFDYLALHTNVQKHMHTFKSQVRVLISYQRLYWT